MIIHKLKVPIALLILLALLASYAPPIQVHAQEAQGVGLIVAQGLSCTIGGLAADWLVAQAFNGLRALYNILPTKITTFLGKGVASILFPPDVPTNDERNNTKEHFGDIVARCGAMALLDTISRQTIAGVRTSGRDGGPSFVRNWRNFKLSAQRRGEDIARAIIGSAELCPYFSGDIRTIFKATNQPDGEKTNPRVNNLDS